MLAKLVPSARALVLILAGVLLASFLPAVITGIEAATGGPTVKVLTVNTPVGVGGSSTQVGSLSLAIGRYLVEAKVQLVSDPNDVRVNCHLAIGAGSDGMSIRSTADGVEVVMLAAGRLTSAGNAVVTCQTVPPVGGVDALGLKIVATKIGSLTNVP